MRGKHGKKFKIRRRVFACLCLLVLGGTVTYFGSTKVNSGKIEPYNVLTYNNSSNESQSVTSTIDNSSNSSEVNKVLYLSDIPYSKGQVEWGNIALDKTQSNTALILRLNNSSTTFKKGIWAHATSTLEYDISGYNKEYKYFTTYYGLNTTAGSTGNGVKFYIYTSKDGKEWTLQTDENPVALKGTDNVKYAKIDISEVNYIRLYANNNGSNASDHAVWADTKLVKENYSENVMMTVEKFDKIIKEAYKSGPIEGDLKLTLLQRDFIYRVGQYQLRTFLEEDPKNKETIEWFLNDEEALRLWTIGGTPNGSYQNALKVLSQLYHTYGEDLKNENLTANGIKYKDLYLKMMLSLSLTHSTNVGLWIGGNQLSNAVNRYKIYKEMHLNNKLEDNSMFENYTIEEMRGVMFTNIDDEEILWLRDYSANRYPDRVQRFNPYKYITYTTGYGYYRPQYYSQANYAKWDKKYNLSAYKVPYQAGKPKLWIVFEEGAVCGGLSKTAANLYGVWGYPAKVVGQPGHAAYLYLYKVNSQNYAWQLANSVASTGWANTEGGGRMPNGWGNRYATSNGLIKPGSYHFLSQQAQNEYDKYERSELILLLESVYSNDRKKLEAVYREALKEEIINLDAWIGLVNLYITDNTKTEEELIALAEEISEVYTYHPLPMYDLTRRIATKITSPGYRGNLMTLQDQTLKKAAKATSANTLYYKEVPVVANALLGIVDNRIATFSFDGANAGKIILSKQLQSTQVTWKYSLDGGKTWKECYEYSVQLTDEEIASIDVNNDIKIHITGVPLTEANIYTIDITKGVFPTNAISIDDLENRINGDTSKLEWTLDVNGEWNSFADTNPIFKGDVVVYVRLVATGTAIKSNPVHYTFTTNASSDTHRYIPRANLNVVEVSGTSGGNKDYILDGNTNTSWHSTVSSFGGNYKPAYATIELDKPRYVAELDYVPDPNAKTPNGNYPTGIASRLQIFVSMDNKNWELVADKSNLGNNGNLKKIAFNEVKEAKYIRIYCPSVYEPGLEHYFSISVVNLYEDPSASVVPTAEVNYNITKVTNKNVIVELINENRPITITNNNGKKTYTFTENGEFTFEFVDKNGNKGSTTAKVDWIDKTPPQASVSFSTTELTNEEVVATLTFDKKNVTILSEDVQVSDNPVDNSKTITFDSNASYELKFADELGNIGTKNITVDWIDKEAPTANFIYNTTHLTDKPVTVTLDPSEEVTVTNNGGKDTYTFNQNGEFTFEFVDRAGNTGTATAIVNWIAKVPKYTLTYSPKEWTTGNVTVTLDLEEGYTLVSNYGNNVYTFTENGEDSFEYIDENGNRGSIPIKVSWIDREDPTGTIEYSPNYKTNKSVTATLIPSEEVTVTNNNGSKVYTFTENGEFTFTFVDRVGHQGTATAIVDWIDKVKPNATLSYDITEETDSNVTVTVSFDKDNVRITNNNGRNKYTFTENGEFTFTFADEAGNTNSITAKVTWIKKKEPENDEIISSKYEIANNIIRKVPINLEVNEFMKNIQTQKEVVIKDKNQNIIKGTQKIGTGMKAHVGNNSYTFIVTADVDGNGTINLTDLAKMCLHYIEEEKLVSEYFEAADIDGNGKITIKDLAKMQLLLIGDNG